MAKDDPDQILAQMYHETLEVLKKGISTGASNVPLSLSSLDAYFDLLHGGALRPDKAFGGNNSIPSVMRRLPASGGTGAPTPDALSPYYTGVQWANYEYDILSVAGVKVQQLGTGEAQDVLANANVPTLFPKLLSDQFMARWLIFRAQVFTVDLFTNVITGVGTGLKTFVEAASEAAGIPGQLAGAARTRQLVEANTAATTDASDNQ